MIPIGVCYIRYGSGSIHAMEVHNNQQMQY